MTEKELSREVADAINNMTFSDKKFCEAMSREHRTLQQSFTRLCFEWIKTCSQLSADPRNEAAVEACKILQKTIEEEDLFLPYI